MIEISLRKKLNTAEGEVTLEADLNIETGTVNTLYGASGTGKTSTFRMLAGLLAPEEGKIVVNGKTWYNAKKKINLKPQQRNAGFMFQDYALFPNMSVRQNLEFALKNDQDKAIIDQLMDIIALNNLQHRKPETLSGGQKQRVAFARALVNQPDLVLLDEPLAALDKSMRHKLQKYIAEVQREMGFSMLIISHDVGEILRLSHHVFQLENGKIAPSQKPASFFTTSAVSGKFQFEAEVLGIQKEGIIYILNLLVGNRLIKIVAQPDDVENLSIGDQVIVASKGFNPLIYKI